MANLPAVQEVRTAIEKMAPQFKAALPPHVSVEKFVRVTLTAVQTNPQLLEADRRTLFAAATKAAQMGLLPDGREGAIVTFKNQAQWMPMVGGVMKLVRNSGEISTWSVQAVYENDNFEFALGDDEHISHKPALSNRGKLIAVYSIVTMKDGEKSREVMSVEDVEAIRKRSRSGNAGPWVTDFAEMAKKTVVRRHSKRLPLSTDIDGVVHDDDALFMPPEPTAAPEQDAQAGQNAEAKPSAAKRPSRLQKVAEQAPADDGPAFPHVDEDGVIDAVDTSAPATTATADEHDSPI
jgi:recombination protein RecT